MHFFHTSDWHLGQSLYGQSREHEHAAFLSWLLDQITIYQPDALLIAGDIFDTVNPPISAQEQLYRFLAEAHTRQPSLQIIMIAGNHDSGGRIELPAPLLKALRTHVIGRVRWLSAGVLDTEQLLIPMMNQHNEIDSWCLAMPFLRPAEVTAGGQGLPTMEAVTHVYQQLITTAKEQAEGLPLVLMSHAHLLGGATSEESERSIVIGTAEALSTDLFPSDISYVALGHLHRPQSVGQDRIRYSGSPIPMSFSEESYQHQVLHIQLRPDQPAHIESLVIPRAVTMIRISGVLADVLAQLAQLDPTPRAISEQPFLEVRVYPDNAPFPPDTRQQIEATLPTQAVRLIRFRKESWARIGDGDPDHKLTVKEQTPQSLYEKVWSELGHSPDPEVFADFAALIDELNQSEQDVIS
ncbi:exonuclease subunit SbcD [Aquirhabdus sp.]|uniref:exonuclease subunit SbcD n=1 Tax=Aquirhabdus sp. TaxID=2824160 RepID=UPI00396CE0E7